ncbi:MAG TPA: hypothetical protein VGW10_13975 [Solirubrobacteraceae bacterium]|nr:hypothetical protein [Solirubrobacteraceae bacterium]
MDRGADVQVDQPQLLVELGAGGERAARPDPGVEGERIDRAAGRGDPRVELLDALGRREVGLHGLDGRAERLDLARRGRQLGVLRVDDQVEAVGGEPLESCGVRA